MHVNERDMNEKARKSAEESREQRHQGYWNHCGTISLISHKLQEIARNENP
jgi:hypothetical protein